MRSGAGAWLAALLVLLAGCAKTGLPVGALAGADAGPSPDAGPPPDASRPDAPAPPPVRDAGPPPGDVDVEGVWHQCRYALHLEPGGALRRIVHELGCAQSGAWSVRGNVLTLEVEADGCEEGGSVELEVVRAAGGLLMIDTERGTVARFADDAAPRRRYRLVGRSSDAPRDGSTIARVVGDPADDFGQGCFWSEDLVCGGVLACSGAIDTWRTEGTRFDSLVTCGGRCVCGGVIAGDVGADGVVTGTYRVVNCERVTEGRLRITEIDDG